MNLVLALMAGAVAEAVVPTVARAVADGQLRRGQRSVRVVVTVTVLVLAVVWTAARVLCGREGSMGPA